jgi:hypothetical protein
MPWFKVDDTLAFHSKIVAAGNAAMGLWARAGAWSMQQLSDGFVPRHIARQLGSRAEAQRLVDVGLWIDKGDGYAFHEWTERQPSRAKVKSDREANAKRLAEWRDRKRKRVKRMCNAVSNAVTNALRTLLVTQPPTRPDPTHNYRPRLLHASTDCSTVVGGACK